MYLRAAGCTRHRPRPELGAAVRRVKSVLCAEVIRLRASYTRNDEEVTTKLFVETRSCT